MSHYSMTGHAVRTIYIIRSAVGKCVYGRIDGIVLGIRRLRRRTAVETEMRSSEKYLPSCGQEGTNSEVQCVPFILCLSRVDVT
jgi:hypothetical protein